MKTIVWDVDDVLNDLMKCWFDDFLSFHEECPLTYADITQNPPHEILGLTKEAYLSSLDDFRLSQQGQKMRPVNEILEWFKCHGSKCRHMALTSRPRQTVAVASQWVFEHFGDWIRTFHFIPAERAGEDILYWDKDKREFLRWLNKADALIEDNEENIQAARDLGITALMMPRPWNAETKQPVGDMLNELTQVIES